MAKSSELKSKKKTGASRRESELVRLTVLVDKEDFEKLKAAAFWYGISMTEIVERQLKAFLSDKKIDPIPEKKSLSELFDS